MNAEHDGYKRLKGCPIHSRKWKLSSNQLIVLDEVKGKGFHEICIRFYLHPNCYIKEISSNF